MSSFTASRAPSSDSSSIGRYFSSVGGVFGTGVAVDGITSVGSTSHTSLSRLQASYTK
jgi:hypothetical protein